MNLIIRVGEPAPPSPPQHRDTMHAQACRHGEDDLIPNADWHFAGLSCNYVYNRRCCVRICQWVTSQRVGSSLWCNPIFRHNVSNKAREPLPALLMAHYWHSFSFSAHMSVSCVFLSVASCLPLLPVKHYLSTESFKLLFTRNWKEATSYDFAN